MKKVITVLAIALFTISMNAQEAKPMVKKGATSKTMSKADTEKCKAKCKAEGKKCDKDMKKCCSKK